MQRTGLEANAHHARAAAQLRRDRRVAPRRVPRALFARPAAPY